MGACGSIPKAMRSGVDIGGAPPPKEETSTTMRATDKYLVMNVEQGGEKEPQCSDDFAKPEDDKNKDGDRQSLGSLLESKEVKELPKTQKIISPEIQTIAEEQKSEALPASDKASEEPAEKDVTPYVAPVARATEEDKEIEKK